MMHNVFVCRTSKMTKFALRDEVKFYPKYPFIYPDVLDPYEGERFNDVIVTKKEFAMEKLDRIEPVPSQPGEYLRHQRYIARYMETYDELLLFHEPGTGKTCTAVAAIEKLRYAEDQTIKRAIVCAKGEGLTKNFLQEFMFTCTDGRYIPEEYDQLTDIQRVTRVRKSASSFYIFKTFETFARDMVTMSDDRLRRLYEDTIFVLDEVHNLREHETAIDEENPDIQLPAVRGRAVNIYDEFHRLFHVLNRRKIILMSGTPIKDTPDEFASIMNLLLPSDKQLNVKNFIRDYFNTEQTALIRQPELASIIRGRVSYLNSATTSVMKNYIGKKIGNLSHFIVYESLMSDFQTRAYERAYDDDKRTRTIFIQSRQASLFVFPDGSYGSKGFKKYVENKRELVQMIRNIKSVDDLYTYSAKYAQFVEILLSDRFSKSFVYCQYVNGSGAIVLCHILEAFGFSKATGKETTKGLRYALCTRSTSTPKQIQRLVNRFNREDNVDGEYISVIVGSRVLNEGFTLKDVRNEFIMTGHWNYAEVAQAIARGWRFGSHTTMINRGYQNVHVDVYQCVSMPNADTVPSIDLELYETSEKKDVVNRLLERLIKETSFDCALAINRNKVTGYDGQRECDYQSCDYVCDGTIGSPLDTSTYGLLREVKEATRTKVKEYIADIVKNSSVSLDFVVSNLVEFKPEEITEAVASIISSSDLFTDAYGFPHFLTITVDNKLFLTSDPVNERTGYLNEYYVKNKVLVVKRADPFGSIVKDMYEKALPDLVTNLFTYKELTRKLLVDFPYRVQRTILHGCLIAEQLGKTVNVDVRTDILNFYKGFYGMRNGKLTVWLFADEIGMTCYDTAIGEFIPCENEMEPIKASSVGWYGLYNPTTNDFCLRNLAERDVKRAETEGIDLRKLAVGKRCVNYEKNKLLEIANKIEIPAAHAMSKKELCADMKQWFETNNLLETNFDCGTSKKSRVKFA